VRACGSEAPLCSISMELLGTPSRGLRYFGSTEMGICLGTRKYGCSSIHCLACGSLLCESTRYWLSSKAARYLPAQGTPWRLRIMGRAHMGSPLGSAKVCLIQNPLISMCGSSKHVSCLRCIRSKSKLQIFNPLKMRVSTLRHCKQQAGTCSCIWCAADLNIALVESRAADLGMSLRCCRCRQERTWRPTGTWVTGSDEKRRNTPQGRCRVPEPLVRTSEWQRPLFDRLPAAACLPADWQACPAWCLYQTAPHSTFQLTFRVIALSAPILSSCYCLGSAYHSHLIFNALCATALLLWLCSPADWQAFPAWCLYQTAPNSTFSSLPEW